MEEQAQEQQQNDGSKAWLGVIAVVVIVAIAGFAYKQSTTQKQQTLGASDKQEAKIAAKPTDATSSYKDGKFTAEGDYMTHVGQKHISVTLTFKNGVIADADVTNQADDPMSTRYQDAFISGYKQYVVGKKIDEVHVSKVASSSLTPIGFNNALDAIKKQSQAQS